MKVKIKPCPFCGSKRIKVEEEPGWLTGYYDDLTGEEISERTNCYYCKCQECNASSPTAAKEGKFAGINEWNTRADMQNTNGKFKSCPFCGSDNIQVVEFKSEDEDIDKYYCKCNDCGSFSDSYLRELLAITAWNTRAEVKNEAQA